VLGAETTDCDSPIALINATFQWIDDHLKDSIDFVVWTGDSVRHDNDEEIPRTEKQVEDLNALLVTKFVEVFGKDDNINDTDPTNDFIMPIVPSLGNNDVLPHNILAPGPNRWTKSYLNIWKKFIPEEQRHGFDRGGWFLVEVIPKKLAVFSLNTLFFFSSNTAVYGCARESDPGYEHFEWLRVQLQFLRQRGMKAIISGHVPPARTQNKSSWDETCWHKYALWMQQYRDIVVGSVYGHMNIDHFMLQDFREIDPEVMDGKRRIFSHGAREDDVTTQSTAGYLTDLRSAWSRLPNINSIQDAGGTDQVTVDIARRKKRRSLKHKQPDHEKPLEKIGGHWGERYSATLVSPSVVPNYFPTLRVIEYNITGLNVERERLEHDSGGIQSSPDSDVNIQTKKKRKGRSRGKNPKFVIPDPPSKSAPPGPAYSPQTLTWLSFSQYFANLTTINNDFNPESSEVLPTRWHNGKHSGKRPHPKPPKHPTKEFKFEVEYDTKTDRIFKLKDLTVRSLVNLAARIGRDAPDPDNDPWDWPFAGTRANRSSIEAEVDSQDPMSHPKGKSKTEKKKKKNKHKSHKKKKGTTTNHAWWAFLRRAYVSTKDDDDLRDDFEL
jgi:endopolyphosphatase